MTNKELCHKSGDYWNNEHVNKVIINDENITFVCIKCNRKNIEPKTELSLILLNGLLK